MSGTKGTLLFRQYSPSSLQLGESLYFWLMQINTISDPSIAKATFSCQMLLFVVIFFNFFDFEIFFAIFV